MYKKVLLFVLVSFAVVVVNAAEVSDRVKVDFSRCFELREAFAQAVSSGSYRVVREVLSLFDIHEKAYIIRQSDCLGGGTCLHIATLNNDFKMVKILVNACPIGERFEYLRTLDPYYGTCLHLAAKKLQEEMCVFYIKKCPEEKRDEFFYIRDDNGIIARDYLLG